MRSTRVRGGSLIELALLAPLVAFLAFVLFNVGSLFVRQIQLERLSAALARNLAMPSFTLPDAARAEAWLSERGFPDIRPDVDVLPLASLPRVFPHGNRPLRVLSVTLRRAGRGPVELRAHAREVML